MSNDFRTYLMADASSGSPHLARWSCRRIGCLIASFPCALVSLFLIFVTVLSPPAPPSRPVEPLPDDFLKGISYESVGRGAFASADSDRTLEQIILPTGANWIAVIIKCYQETRTSTEIDCQSGPLTSSDEELRHVVARAHDLGLNVMLKPHIDLNQMENSLEGRFNIGFGDDEAAWDAWFESYGEVVTHYARLAQAWGVGYFVVGTELAGTVHREDDWRNLIRQVREVYDGPLTYAALTYFEPLQIKWWDALDAIGIDAYYAISLTPNPTVEQMKLMWRPLIAYIGWLADRWAKPVIITEAGYMSVDGATVLPGDWSMQAEIDLQEQADAYRALFESFYGQPWWQGIFWWSQYTDPQRGGRYDRGYSFHGKPAADVLRQYFRGHSEGGN
ncbi:MAG: hypothetical protein DIU68_013990 [Chloroflexota bacterium]|nr:MAG: hypothetical protein DIU68_12950 [Chloroflexota bacterium]